MIHSKYQEDVFRFFNQNPLNNGLINAVAGSGKSYTLIKGADQVPTSKSILVCAFNKLIQTDFASKLTRTNSQVFTYNSFGNRICKASLRNVEFDMEKTQNTLQFSILRNRDEQTLKRLLPVAKRIVSIAKATLIPNGHELAEQLNSIAADYAIEFPKGIDCHSLLPCLYDEIVMDTKHMDFDDQLFFPWRYNLRVPEFDLVIVDEFQDTSPIQAWLMKEATGDNGSQIVAGDPHQCIYTWRGADLETMSRFKKQYNAIELPLSVCYRCCKSVIKEAQKIVPHIEAAPDAIEGILDTINIDKYKEMAEAGNFVLCRTTAPLIETCLQFIKNRKPANVRGREIGTDLANTLNRVGGNDVPEFLTRLNEYDQTQSAKLETLNKEQALIEHKDKMDCLKVLAEVNNSIPDMIRMISTMFIDNNSAGITCMTIHKSKGLQSKRVFIIRPDQLPMRKNSIEEMNIKYVGVTRAQEELYFVEKK